MKRIILCVLVAASGLAKEPDAIQKPACKAALHGKFWPDAANTDVKAAGRLAQCGALEICTTTGWRYKWQPVTVNVRQLGKSPQDPTPACVRVMEEYGEKGPLVTSR
jgi:hypothetical protein